MAAGVDPGAPRRAGGGTLRGGGSARRPAARRTPTGHRGETDRSDSPPVPPVSRRRGSPPHRGGFFHTTLSASHPLYVFARPISRGARRFRTPPLAPKKGPHLPNLPKAPSSSGPQIKGPSPIGLVLILRSHETYPHSPGLPSPRRRQAQEPRGARRWTAGGEVAVASDWTRGGGRRARICPWEKRLGS